MIYQCNVVHGILSHYVNSLFFGNQVPNCVHQSAHCVNKIGNCVLFNRLKLCTYSLLTWRLH